MSSELFEVKAKQRAFEAPTCVRSNASIGSNRAWGCIREACTWTKVFRSNFSGHRAGVSVLPLAVSVWWVKVPDWRGGNWRGGMRRVYSNLKDGWSWDFGIMWRIWCQAKSYICSPAPISIHIPSMRVSTCYHTSATTMWCWNENATLSLNSHLPDPSPPSQKKNRYIQTRTGDNRITVQ